MEAQHQQQRLMDLYAALLDCDAAIIRSTQKADMFEAVCQSLVAPGGMQLVWIGMLDPGDQRLWPQAHCSEGWTDLDWMRLMSLVDQLPGQGMAGAAIDRNQAVWSDSMLESDPLLQGEREMAPARAWRSAAAIPLHVGGKACGVLAIYGLHAHGFEEGTRTLLLRLVANISIALDALERDEQPELGEFKLLESEVRYNALFASNPMPMLVVDPADGRVVDANIRAMNFYGWDHATITTKCVADINILSSEKIREEMAQSVAASRSYYNFQHRLANGEVRDVEVFTSPSNFNGKTYLVSAIHDVTARRVLEAKVQQTQSLMQRFIDELPGTAFVKDSSLRLLMANRQLGALLGVAPETLIGKTAHDIFPTDFADFVTQLDQEVMELGGHRVYEEEFHGRRNETSMFVIEDAAGERFLGALSLDVTDRFHARERSAALLRINELAGALAEKELLNAGLDMALRLTESTVGVLYFVHGDQQSVELMAWTHGAGQNDMAATDAALPLSRAGLWADCMRKGAPAIFNDLGGQPLQHGLPSGEATLARLVSVPVVESGKVRMLLGVANRESDYQGFDVETLLLLGNDLWRIARRGRLEASLKHRVNELVEVNRHLADMQLQLLQSEKMASIGQLASGVAHEINNPIGFVKSNLGTLSAYVNSLLDIVRAYEDVEHIHGEAVAPALLAIEQRKKDMDYAFVVEDVKKLIDESTEGVQRVSQIVLDLKNFSRTGSLAEEATDLQAGIESTINVVWNQLKYKVEVLRNYAPLPPVRCVASQINQVVMNLLTNAEQSITGHGTITVRTGEENDAIWFEVQDTGCGIAPDKLSRIFEPFYTSKPVGQGTGLGLSISFGIVQRHGGHITVQSTPGVGSTFRVTLPQTPALPLEAQP
jgi:PAS domain S-box-containing protein